DLRCNVRVAFGRRPSIFIAGTLVFFQLTGLFVIEVVRYLPVVTVFSKFRKLEGLEGFKLNKVTDKDLKNYNKLLVKAILDAQHTLNIIDKGGEIEKIPSPLMKAVKKVNKLFKNERGMKHGLHR
ncbi:transcriptional regulator, partial [Mammaliicoccus fleurettii]